MSKNVKLNGVLVNLMLAMILFSPLVTNVSSNSSSDVAILSPNNVEPERDLNTKKANSKSSMFN